MIDEDTRLLKIDECEQRSAGTFFIYKPTWDLITKALTWSLQKTEEEIEKRILICEGKKHKGRKILHGQWQLIIETLEWILEINDKDPIQSRLDNIPFSS